MKSKAEAIIAVAILFGIVYVAEAPLATVLVSVLLAFAIAPLTDALQKLRIPRAVAALIAMLIFLAAVYGVVYVSYNQVVTFLEDLPKYSQSIRQMGSHFSRKMQTIQKTAEQALPPPNADSSTVKVQPVSNWTDMFGSMAKATEFFLYAVFVPFLAYFMLTWKEHVRAATVRLFREDDRQTAHDTLGEIASMLRTYIVGNLLVGLFIGVISLVVFAALKLPHFYFVGLLSGYLSLVPYAGVLLALLPPLMAGLQQLHSGGFAAIALTVLALHLFALNVLYPKFLGSSLQLNPFAATLGLLFWGWIWGPLGLVLAIPIMGGLKIIFDRAKPLRPYGVWLGDEESQFAPK